MAQAAKSEYEEVLASLYALEAARGMDFKLERVTLALSDLGNPHRQYPVVHIAGTNGKGSVAAMLHSILAAGGQRVGLYTSPHLVRFSERIRVGSDEISEAEVIELAREVHRAATLRGIELTFFEFVTVMAFVHFARSNASIVVVETGLGGRLDATNVVDPQVSIITSIGLDHQEYLGDSLAEIAAEKAGIIKPGRPVVVGRVPDEARAVIASVAAARGSMVLWAGQTFDLQGSRFESPNASLESIQVGLRGAHQRDNAAVAIMAALLLGDGLRPSTAAVRDGVASVAWPGRLEVVQQRPTVLLDGAHNLDGVRTLIREVEVLRRERRLHLLFSVMNDKDWPGMVDALAPLASRVTVTDAFPRRSAPLSELARRFETHCPVEVVEDPQQALTMVLANAGVDGLVVVCGSLFLVGAVYPRFLAAEGMRGVFDRTQPSLHP